MISLNGWMRSVIDFREPRKQALSLVARGEKIRWFFDMGFFSHLTFPLGDEREFKAHRLALDHFMATLWEELGAYSQDIILYNGPLSVEGGVETMNKLSHYLTLLTAQISDLIPFSLEFQDNSLSPFNRAALLHREYWDRFTIKVDQADPYPAHSKAVLMPSVTAENFEGVEFLMDTLNNFRVVHEPYLTSEWDGVDELYVSSSTITSSALRKLKGFNAAGGLVVTLGKSLSLPLEKEFQ